MLATLIGNKGSNRGSYVIEILIVIAIIVVALTTLLGIVVFSLNISTLMKQTTAADSLARETIEAVRSFRDGTDWNTNGLGALTIGSDYYPELDDSVDPPQWIISGGTETINGFTRKVVFEKVSRSSSTGEIESAYNPVNDDPDTRRAIVTVFWNDKEVEIITYLTNWQ